MRCLSRCGDCCRVSSKRVSSGSYVSPSVWAWRGYRVRKIARAVDLVLTLFPFEGGIYERAGVAYRFVGHPLADAIGARPDRAPARERLGLPGQGEIVALLPGSRMSEVTRLAGPMAAAATWLVRRRPGLSFCAPLVNRNTRECFEAAFAADFQEYLKPHFPS